MFLAKVFVKLKATINDPQGLTIMEGLHSLGFSSVSSVRAGKYLEVQINETNKQLAEEKVEAMCTQLLANPVIEESTWRLEQQDH